MNFYRKLLFGDEPLVLFETAPSGDNELLTLAENWVGQRVKQKGVELKNQWLFQIADQSSLTVTLMTDVALFKIGPAVFKIDNFQDPLGNSGLWKLEARRIK